MESDKTILLTRAAIFIVHVNKYMNFLGSIDCVSSQHVGKWRNGFSCFILNFHRDSETLLAFLKFYMFNNNVYKWR